MPAAVARKRYSGSVTEEQARAARRRPASSALQGRAHHRSAAVAAPHYQPAPVVAAPLPVLQPGHGLEAVPAEALEQARAARRRARRAHRPLQCSWSTGLGITVVMGQLVALLWLQGMALSARDRSYALDKRIATVQEGLSRTQQEIAALDSSPQLAGWAQARGWPLATQDKLDPVTPDAARWQPVAPAEPTAALPRGSSRPRYRHRAPVDGQTGTDTVMERTSRPAARRHGGAEPGEGTVR